MTDSARPFSQDPVLAPLRRAAAASLWRLEAVRVRDDEPFALASGNRSPLYVDCRRVISSPAFMQLFVAAARALLDARAVRFDAVAGGETAGIPYAAYLASALSRPLVYVRKAAKGHGTGSQVEGALRAGARVLLVEDLITDGGSKLAFLDGLAAAGATVADALVLFDRQQGGAALLAERGVTLHAVTDLDVALDVGLDCGALAPAARSSVDAYRADPEAWHRARGLEYQG